MKDIIERAEDAAETQYYRMIQPDGMMKCYCGRFFDPDEEGTVISQDPYAMPVCNSCFQEFESNRSE